MKIRIMIQNIKSFFVFTVIMLLCVIFMVSIVHNILKLLQISNIYTGKYKNVVALQNGDVVNLYQMGDGDKSIIILPGYGAQSPVIIYKNLAEKLKDNYKVVIVEYPGYGFAKNTENPRTNENFAIDINEALEKSKIVGPYVLMPHSISNMYAMKFAQMYPDKVEAIISLDGIYPENINNKKYKEDMEKSIKNIKITSKIEYTGLARILSYVKPDIYYIDKMKKYKSFDTEDIKLYRKMIATNYLTSSMINEIDNLKTNMEELKYYKYSDNLPVLHILSSETVNEFKEKYKDVKIEDIVQNTISNSSTQKVVKIDGIHMINFSSLDDVINQINNFLV